MAKDFERARQQRTEPNNKKVLQDKTRTPKFQFQIGTEIS